MKKYRVHNVCMKIYDEEGDPTGCEMKQGKKYFSTAYIRKYIKESFAMDVEGFKIGDTLLTRMPDEER